MPRKSKKRSPKKDDTPAPVVQDRRAALNKMLFYGIGAGVVAAGGGVFAMDLRRKLQELDLTRVGQGTATVVQIHDPQCALCNALQRQARKALRLCDETKPDYLVANVRTGEGSAFQAALGLPHVTLAFFDPSGRHVHTIQGVTEAREIKEAFQEHLGSRAKA